jgi:hypothetical protein
METTLSTPQWQIGVPVPNPRQQLFVRFTPIRQH